MKRNLYKSLMMITIVASIVLTGCGKQNSAELAGETEVLYAEAATKEVDTMLPTETPKAVVVKAEETAIPNPAETVTATPKPAATAMPKPTATATPKPTATATPKPSATPEPVTTSVAANATSTGKTGTTATEAPKEAPSATAKPVATPESTMTPTATATPSPTPAPTVAPTPEPTAAPCNHNYAKSYWPSAPTCTTSGDYAMVCTICGAVGDTGTDPKLAHTPVTVDDPAATYCDEHGVKVTTCSVCGAELDREGYSGSEHDWVTGLSDPIWDDEKQDFVTEEVTYCSRCHAHP